MLAEIQYIDNINAAVVAHSIARCLSLLLDRHLPAFYVVRFFLEQLGKRSKRIREVSSIVSLCLDSPYYPTCWKNSRPLARRRCRKWPAFTMVGCGLRLFPSRYPFCSGNGMDSANQVAASILQGTYRCNGVPMGSRWVFLVNRLALTPYTSPS